MQNAANNNSNFTVENLVAKYRNYVAENCPKEYFCDEYKDKDGKWHTSEGYMPFSPDGDADEQLIVTMYKQVAGNNADERVLNALSKYAETFYSNALTEEEFSFLCSNFEETVAFSFSYIKEHKGRMGYEPVPSEMIDIIKENTIAEKGSTVFISDAGNGDVASLFAGSKIKGYTSIRDSWIEEELWALTQIRLYSQGILSELHISEKGCTEGAYIEDVDCIVWGTAFHSSYNDAVAVYQAAKPGTQMILFMDDSDAAGNCGNTYDIRKLIVEEQSIKSIISFEYNDMWLNVNRNKIAVIIEKKVYDIVHVRDGITGMSFDIASSNIDPELLWPSFYSTKRPENGIPLSEIVAFVDLADREVIKDDDGDWVLPEGLKEMPVAVPAKMAREYKDANLLMQDLDLAGSKLFDDQWKFWIRALKEPCVLLYGNKEKTVVGYIRELPKTGIATLDTIVCLVPKDGIDVRYVAALLLTPEVKEQLESICQNSINDLTFPLVMNKVIVPNHSDKERLEFMSEANYEALNSLRTSMRSAFDEKFQTMKKEYIDEVRMRKHDMGQKVFDLINTEDLMRYYVENRETENDLWPQLEEQLDHLRHTIHELSEMLDHLSQEEHFGFPELINLDEYLRSMQHSNNVSGFALSYQLDKDGVAHALLTQKDDNRIADEQNIRIHPTVWIAKNDIQRVVGNIISNAQKHGFIDSSRRDYEVKIVLSFNSEKGMYQIDFRNNGQPLPEGLNKMRYGIKGEKAGQTAGTGLGGSVVKSIVKHYKGDYDVFMDGEWTVVRIYLPIAI